MIVDSPYHGIVYRGGDELFEKVTSFISVAASARSTQRR